MTAVDADELGHALVRPDRDLVDCEPRHCEPRHPAGRAVPIAAVLSSSLVCALIIGSRLDTPFGPIDDHEPLRWMGSDGRLQITEAWPTFRRSEVGEWGSSGRWRPA